MKLGKTQTTTSTTAAPAAPSVAAVRGRIGEIEQQLDTARQAHESHMAQAQQRIMGGADVLDIEAEAAGLRGNVAALENAIAGMNTMLVTAVSNAAGEHIHGYSATHAAEAERLRVLAVGALECAVAALDPVLAEASRADGRLEAQRQASNLLLGVDRAGGEHIRARGLALLDRIGPLRNELERLRFTLNT
jgi:uncharacterized small protein (DUF1192 family)